MGSVTIRTLDPPLHEFLPPREELMVNLATLPYMDTNRKTGGENRDRRCWRQRSKKFLPGPERVEKPHEPIPCWGTVSRLGITYPRLPKCKAHPSAVAVAKMGSRHPEVMIPLTATVKEMANQAEIVNRVAKEVFKEKGRAVEYLVGTMIELPRAALIASEIAKEAEFFSFGTNDLTQTTWGFSRDDVNKILPTYLEQGIIKQDPFAVLDQEGVGQLVKMATERGRKSRPNLKVGICGEHGGEPSSVEFCYHTGLNYVSCSPFRVLTARLAAAQAAAGEKIQGEAGRTK